MYKVSIPISILPITEDNLSYYIETAKKCKADRIFLCCFGNIYTDDNSFVTQPEKVKTILSAFKENGFETGFWIDAFGHGVRLAGDESIVKKGYQTIEGVDGRKPFHAICPLDKNFQADYQNALKKIASFKPDLIMLDDDFRINTREAFYHTGCFCPLHLKEFYARVGETVPREQIEKLLFTGEKNKYRSAYLSLLADSILDFSKGLRSALDEVDDTIRLGACCTYEAWDASGTNAIEIAKTLAGKTQPFCRISGAPYWQMDIIPIIETSRLQYFWKKNTGVEAFSEGDTYPRPRYNIPSKCLELFDFVMLADGSADGMLAYIFDYLQKPEYETGYVDRYIHNEKTRNAIKEFFGGKKPVGVKVFNQMGKIENWSCGESLVSGVSVRMQYSAPASPSEDILAKNSIPTTFDGEGYPLLLFGENAKYAKESDFANGCILDLRSARILQARGIDTGLIDESSEDCSAGEYYIAEDAVIPNVCNDSLKNPNRTYQCLKSIRCSQSAEVYSLFRPSNTPSSYYYENTDGLKFFVLAFDYDDLASTPNSSFFNNYYRQAHLVKAIERLCGKKLPAVCIKNPNLYILASKDKDALSVALVNISPDDILAPEIKLEREFNQIRFLNCDGVLREDKVTLSDLPPYSFVGFEVK